MIKITDGVCTVKPESTFTIYDVEQFVHSIREKLPSITAVRLDFSAVNEFDTAGFQTVYSLYKSLQEQKVAMSFIASSTAIERIVNLFGVDEWYQTLLKEGEAHEAH